VVTPISNDKLLSSSSSKTGGSDTKSTGGTNRSSTDTGSAAATPEAGRPADDTVNIDRASQLYRSAASEPTRSTGKINTSEEAAQLAARISEQLTADSSQAMQAQAGGLSRHIGSLLSTAP